MATPTHQSTATGRIALLDAARSAAIAAMVLYHIVFDLEMFGWISRGTALSPLWRLLAICTASSFLVIAGISFSLGTAHGRGTGPFLKRWAQIAGGAALVSIGTYVILPDAFVFFGILHAIAAALLIGRFLVVLPVAVLTLMAALIVSLPYWGKSQLFNAPIFWWTGLQTAPVTAVDYIPLAPWLGAFVFGLAIGKSGLIERLAWVQLPRWTTIPGRYSLSIYLLHQPILFAVLSGLRLLV